MLSIKNIRPNIFAFDCTITQFFNLQTSLNWNTSPFPLRDGHLRYTEQICQLFLRAKILNHFFHAPNYKHKSL